MRMIFQYIRSKMEEMDFSSQNPATSNVLNLAARKNDEKNVARLLKKMNPNLVDNRGWTCLHEAAHYDSYESLILILKCPKTRGRVETHEGHTALYLACKNSCSLKTVKALLDAVPNIANYGSTEGVTPLHIASSYGNVEVINLLLEYGAIMDVRDYDGDTPMHEAVLAAQHPALITLLYAGADPEIKNRPACFTPFHLACCKGYFPSVESLFPFVSDINQQTTSGDTALHFSLRSSADEIIYFLLENGADPNIKNLDGELPIDIGLSASAKVFTKLLEVTDRAKISRKIFVNACKPHKLQFHILEVLLSSDLGPEFFNVAVPFNPDINRCCLTHTTYLTHAPLNHYLSISGYIFNKSPEKFKEFFYLVLMKGVGVNALHATECPPLVYAHYVHNTEHILNASCFNEVFQILVEQGCDVDFRSSGKSLCNGVSISDAFLTSLDIYPHSAPILMPYSIYNEPTKFLQFAVDNENLLVNMPGEVIRTLLTMIDSSFADIRPEILNYQVPSLKHLCRFTFRSYLRNQTHPGFEHTTASFLNIIRRLPIPPVIKKYLRYINN